MPLLRIWETRKNMLSSLPLIYASGLVYQEVDFSGGATASDPFSSSIGVLSVLSDVDCAIAIGDSGTEATVNGFPVPADVRTDFYAQPGQIVSVTAAAS
jgi:hypothetical protein